MPSIKELVLRQLEIDPDISLKNCQKVVKGLKKSNFYKIKREREPSSEQGIPTPTPKQKVLNQAKTIPPRTNDGVGDQFIDDPDELLMSVAKRELNKPNPDPRWANILLSCRKEKINSKNEMTDILQKASTQSLVGLLKKNLQEELD